MLKKLQNLLFEDEEDDEEEEFEPETLPEPPVRTAPVQQPAPQPVYQQPAPQPAPAPVQYERPVYSEPVPAPQPAPQKTMQIIDVTQPLPVINPDYPAPQPVRAQSVFAEETRQPAPAPKKTLGIVADAAPAVKPAPQPVAKPAPAPAVKPVKSAKPTRPAYNFKPVISPIFGVDDKDMNSVKTVTSRINAKEQASKMEGNITPIISPMYGSNTEESIIAPKDVRKTAAAVADIPADDDVPDFSLDDILAVGDEKYAEEKRVVDEAPLFPDLEFDDEVETPAKKSAAKDTL